VVKNIANSVKLYQDNKASPFWGSLGHVSYGFMKKEIYCLLNRSSSRQLTTTTEEDSLQEQVIEQRLEPLVSVHMMREMVNVDAYGTSRLRGPSHPKWILDINDQLMREYFYVGVVGPPFINNVRGVQRNMLTLFAKNNVPMTQKLRFFYTGRLIDSLDYGDGAFEHLAAKCRQNQDLWVIPPEGFHVDNMAMVHPGHFIQLRGAKAHFAFSKQGNMFFITQTRAIAKDEPLFCDYGYDEATEKRFINPKDEDLRALAFRLKQRSLRQQRESTGMDVSGTENSSVTTPVPSDALSCPSPHLPGLQFQPTSSSSSFTVGPVHV
jgi:hypothetical protein